MVRPWMPFSQNGLDHGRHYGWAMDAPFSERIRPCKSPWLGHGGSLRRTDYCRPRTSSWSCSERHHGWAMDAPFSERFRPWTSSWSGHGMLSSQNGLDHGRHDGQVMECSLLNTDHGRYHGGGMVTVFSEMIRPWTSSWLGNGCFLPRKD